MLSPVILSTSSDLAVGVEEEIAGEAAFQEQPPAESLTGQGAVLRWVCPKEAEHRLGELPPGVSERAEIYCLYTC